MKPANISSTVNSDVRPKPLRVRFEPIFPLEPENSLKQKMRRLFKILKATSK